MSTPVDYALSLAYLRPGEAWAMDGNAYEGLVWLDATDKPSAADIEAAWPAAQAQLEATAAARQAAIQKLADSSGLTPEEMAALGIV